MARRIHTAASAAVLTAIAALAGCGDDSPRGQVYSWSLAREPSGKGYVFDAKTRLLGGQAGWFSPKLTLTDERGCELTVFASAAQPGSAPDPTDFQFTFHERFANTHKIARATLTLDYRPASADVTDLTADVPVFSEERVVDPSLHPPQRDTPCPREKKPNQYAPPSSREEMAATMINLAGYLCARVTDAYSSGNGMITVHCTEYRNGRGRAKYRIDTNSAQVEKLD